MSLYCIGDLQGCNAPFQRLLERIDFSPSRDTLYLLGDLVNRGPDSLGVLRSLSALGGAVQCLLGNHDLHLLAMWQGVRKPGRKDTSQAVLQADDASALLHWLRHQRLAMHAHGWLMVHAGVLPQWSAAQTMALAGEVEQALRSADFKSFLASMYGNSPSRWADQLDGPDRLRVIVNALTRLRFCTPQGDMEFTSTGGLTEAPEGYLPWFEVPGRASSSAQIAFGHWSTLGSETIVAKRGMLCNTLPLDTGCVWGGCLTAAKLGQGGGSYELISISCEQAQKPAT